MFATTITAISSPATYLVMDIETADAPESAIQAAIAAWRPSATAKTADEINAEANNAIESWTPPLNIKDPAKIDERRKAMMDKVAADRSSGLERLADRQSEAHAKIRERSALLDSAPVVCIGVQTQYDTMVFNGMDSVDMRSKGVRCLSCGNERDMLIAFRRWVEIYTNEETVIVGQNVKGFDLPKLRSAFMRQRLKLPAILAPRLGAEQTQSVVDTAYLFKSFSIEHRDDFCPSLDTICASLGVPMPKSVVSGAEVPRMVREGRYEEVLVYNAIDVAATARAYLLMSGQASDLE